MNEYDQLSKKDKDKVNANAAVIIFFIVMIIIIWTLLS